MSIDIERSRIAQGLKALRLEHNYTQEYLADVLGKGDYSAYYRLESGKTELKFEDAFKLASLYSISMEEIYDPALRGSSRIMSEARTQLQPASRMNVNVVLDGQEQTLQKQIDLLTKVNELLK